MYLYQTGFFKCKFPYLAIKSKFESDIDDLCYKDDPQGMFKSLYLNINKSKT